MKYSVVNGAVILALSLFCFTGCTSDKSKAMAKTEKDQLILAIGGERPEGYDPITGWGRYGNPLFHSTLLTRDNNLAIQQDLATSHSLSENQLVWSITLREDVKFSDGKPLTAEDVVFTFNQAKQSGGKVDVTALDSAVVLSKNELELRLNRPDITFTNVMITLGIVPKHLYSESYNRNPIGSGPYKFVSWEEGEQLIVEANPLYYGKQPEIKRLVFLFMKPDAAFIAAKSGKVDLLSVYQNLAKQEISGMKLHPVRSVDNRGIMFPFIPDEGKIAPNGCPIGNDVTAHVEIRKAINYAIDRTQLVKSILHGYGEPAYGSVDNLQWDQPEGRIEDNNIELAKKLLADGGWSDTDGDDILEKDGLKASFTILYPAADVIRQSLALAVSDRVRTIGIEMNVVGKSWDEIRRMRHNNAILFGFGNYNPIEMMNLYHSERAGTELNNTGYYKNEQVDNYFDEALKAPSFDASIEYWKKAQWDGTTGLSVRGDAPWAWLVNLTHTYFVKEGLNVGTSRMEPHGHGWPITANITEWKWDNNQK
jgi:peptide/nickel transport system substrate-binding protein